MKETKFKVKGMVCEGCENRLKNALLLVDNVKKVEASYKTGLVSICSEEALSLSDIEEKINILGFEIEKEIK